MVKWVKNKGIKFLYFSLIVFLFFILSIFNAFRYIDNQIMDLYQHEKTSSNITIVAIDEKTLNELGQPSTWQRDKYLHVLDNLNQKSSPSVIAFDILFTGYKENIDIDNSFADKCNTYGNVITGSLLEYGTIINYDEHTYTNSITNISLPYESLKNSTKSGFTNNVLDKDDNNVRKLFPKVKYNDEIYYSFSYLTYLEYDKKNDLKINDYKENRLYKFNYTSKPSSQYSVISFVDIYEDRVIPDLENEIVLIGGYASALQDDFYTPISKGNKMYGVEIHANMIDAFIRNDIVKETNNTLMTFILFLILLVLAFVIYKSHIIVSSIITAISALLGILFQTLAYNSNLYLPLFRFILWIIIIFILNIVVTYLVEIIKRKKIVNIFKKYVAKEVVDKALKDVNYDVNLGGMKKHISCLFVDIRGFTTMSEVLTPEEVVDILNQYLDLTTKSIFAYGGTVDKFIGDCTMAVFNSPFDLEDYEFKAIESALMMRDKANELEEALEKKYGRSVSFGIGVNSGYAVVGNIGSKDRMDYTAIGDTVNTAERLESKAKKGQIIISEDIYNNLKDRIIVEDMGIYELKGKANGVHAYNVIGLKGDE